MLEILRLEPILFIGCSVLLGLIVGSFLNVVIYRLPKMETCEAEGWEAPFNLAIPRSHCPYCQHPIRWWHNIPILSYLLLKGRCPDCQQSYGLQYLLVEILTGCLFGLVAWRFEFSVICLAVWIYTGFAIALSVIDLKWFRLPDRLTFPLLWIGLIFNLNGTIVPLQYAVVGAMAGYLSLWGLYWLFKLLTKREGFGYGDFKLFAAIGAFVGWMALPNVALVGAVSALIAILIRTLFQKGSLRKPIPFGPALCMGGFIVLFWYGHSLSILL